MGAEMHLAYQCSQQGRHVMEHDDTQRSETRCQTQLTEAELAQVAGGGDGPPTGTGTGNGTHHD
jgi:hypothetical protein